MQAIETIVFFMAAVVIAGLILIFVAQLDVGSMYETINNMFFPAPPDMNVLNKTTKEGFPGFLVKCWQTCEFGRVPTQCGNVYITDRTGTMDKTFIEAAFEKYSFCLDCNIILNPDTIELPRIVSVACTNRVGLDINS